VIRLLAVVAFAALVQLSLGGIGRRINAPVMYPQITHSGAVAVRLQVRCSLLEMVSDHDVDPFGQMLVGADGEARRFPQW